MTTPNLLFVDDHPVVLDGMRNLFETHMPHARVQTAASLPEAFASEHAPDVIGLDLKLPGLHGLEGLGLVRRQWPLARVCVLSSQDDEETQQRALACGALAFVSKGVGGESIVATVQSLLSGATAPLSTPALSELAQLTPRQREVLGRLHQGWSNKQIAHALGISDNTVRKHVQDIFSFLGVANRTEAVLLAIRWGLVH